MRAQKGFSILELIVVVGVVGFVAAVGIGKFESYQANARQSEAKTTLAKIVMMQTAFHKAHGEFAADLSELGFKVTGGQRYEYSLPAASKTAYTALAQALTNDAILSGCSARDTWVVDQTGRLVATTDCTSR